MAVEAVPSKPLSRPDSLLSGIDIRISGDFAGNALRLPFIPMNRGVISRAFLWIRSGRDGEFDFSYQHVTAFETGVRARPR